MPVTKFEPAQDEQGQAIIEKAGESLQGVVDNQDPGTACIVDLAKFWDDDFTPELPSIGSVAGAGHLFYAGRLNEIHGEPAVGKTNIATAVSLDVIAGGGSVLYLDPEDTPGGMARKLRSFGMKGEDLERFTYAHNPDEQDISKLIEANKADPVTLVILDGLAEALAGAGLNEDNAGDTLHFFREHVRPFADAGSGVLICDHVAKDNKGRWSRGSGAKLGRYDGAVYEVAIETPYDPKTAGAISFKVSKDRVGGVGPKGSRPAQLMIEPTGNGFTRTYFAKPEPRAAHNKLKGDIVEAIQNDPEISLTKLRKLGNSMAVDEAISELKRDEIIDIRPLGKGKQNRYILKDGL